MAELEEHYNDFSRVYDSEHYAGYFEFLNRFEFGKIAGLIGGKSVLEVGCGTGIILERAAKIAKAAVGIDLSPGMLRAARRKGLQVKKANAESIPFPDARFDVAYSFKTLAHVPGIETALCEMARVTKKGGFVVMEFYNSRSLRGVFKSLFPYPQFTKYRSINSMKRLLPPGLEVADVSARMVFTPGHSFFELPLLHAVLSFLERRVWKTPLWQLGSHVVITCRKR